MHGIKNEQSKRKMEIKNEIKIGNKMSPAWQISRRTLERSEKKKREGRIPKEPGKISTS